MENRNIEKPKNWKFVIYVIVKKQKTQKMYNFSEKRMYGAALQD